MSVVPSSYILLGTKSTIHSQNPDMMSSLLKVTQLAWEALRR